MNKLSKIENIMSYNFYKEQFRNQVNITDIISLNESDKNYYDYRKINFQRTARLEKTFIPSEETNSVFKQINNNQQWIIITESWCGDSAQNLPIIASIAGLNKNIELGIVLRDSNLDFMDLYLTNEGRSIPKLIAFDKNGNELFIWGPRPVKAQALYSKLKNQGLSKSDINKELHLWYGKNRGKEVELELLELVKKII